MNFAATLKTAAAALGVKKIRTFLTMLGIIIGITSFILINSLGAGAQSLILNQIRRMGTNIIGILPGASDEKGPPASVFGINITTLKESDADAILRNVPNIVAVNSYVQGAETVNYEGESRSITFMGVQPAYLEVESTEISEGRFISDEDEISNTRVVVFGSTLARELFGDENPVGKSVRLGGEKYGVIGVMKERGATAFMDFDNVAYVPLSTAQKVILGIRHLSFVRAKVDSAEHLDKAMEDIKTLLRQRHRIPSPDQDDFSVRNTQQALGVLTSITDALKLFLTAIAAVSLLVGGVGIMNIMYVSVSERTFEIGLRKAVGAKNRHVLLQFLMEAVLVTLLAGAIGIVFGFLLSWIVSIIVVALEYDWTFVVSWQSIVLASGISAVIGLIFGIYPARRAALMTPREALVYER